MSRGLGDVYKRQVSGSPNPSEGTKKFLKKVLAVPVSYTHLTLPTILLV
ncbi:hypothetical protein JMUB7528_28640 [Staphylococcus aureus]